MYISNILFNKAYLIYMNSIIADSKVNIDKSFMLIHLAPSFIVFSEEEKIVSEENVYASRRSRESR